MERGPEARKKLRRGPERTQEKAQARTEGPQGPEKAGKRPRRPRRDPDEAQKLRQDPQKARPRKGWEEAQKPSLERVLGVLRGRGEVLERVLKVLERFWRGF